MSKGTYIYLDRGILEHWTYEDKPFNRSMAWIDLLLIADHTTHTSVWRGQMTEFKRGDVNRSISELASRWGWSRDKTRRFLLQLEQDNMVRIKSTPFRTVITIEKYDDFQNKRTTDKATDKTTLRTPNKAADKTYLINNKGIIKENKEEVAPLPDSDFDDEEEDDGEWVDAGEWLERNGKK